MIQAPVHPSLPNIHIIMPGDPFPDQIAPVVLKSPLKSPTLLLWPIVLALVELRGPCYNNYSRSI